MKIIVLLIALMFSTVASAKPKPNVLFIAIDDMNDGITAFGKDRPFKTPNIENLTKRGVFFTHAYCSSPACNPSRASILTGKRPHNSGVYGNKTDWRKACRDVVTIPEYFRLNGYHVEGYGKIYHHHYNGAFNDPASWDAFKKMDDQYMPPEKVNKANEYGTRNTDWGPWPKDNEEKNTIDFKSVSYAIDALKKDHDKPFFLACGIFKPHSPFFAPPKYFKPYGKSLQMPLLNPDDWDDLPAGAERLAKSKKWFWKGMMEVEEKLPGSYQRFVQSYAACCSFSDASVGRLIEALDKSPYRDNTIIILWSDHGFHLGEKDHIEKFVLWEKSNHIPFLIVDPRSEKTAGQKCRWPVDMTAIYPTLVELCGLPANPANDGLSVASQVSDPARKIGKPALMTYGRGNHAVRTERWRYIRYADGSEELYDHQNDFNEWKNLAGDKTYAGVIAEHTKWLPKTNAPAAGDLKKKN